MPSFCSASIHLEDVFATMRGVADQATVAQIDDQIQVLERNLPDQHRHVVGNLNDVRRAVAPLDREPHGAVDRGLVVCTVAADETLLVACASKPSRYWISRVGRGQESCPVSTRASVTVMRRTCSDSAKTLLRCPKVSQILDLSLP